MKSDYSSHKDVENAVHVFFFFFFLIGLNFFDRDVVHVNHTKFGEFVESTHENEGVGLSNNYQALVQDNEKDQLDTQSDHGHKKRFKGHLATSKSDSEVAQNPGVRPSRTNRGRILPSDRMTRSGAKQMALHYSIL